MSAASAGRCRLLLICALLFANALQAQAQTPAMSGQVAAEYEYQTGAILWTQSSAEYRALAYQSFSLAKIRLDQALASRRSVRSAKPPAVIVDVDETVMDNSRFQAELVLRQAPFTAQTWEAWCDRAEAGSVPGAVEFLTYAARRRVRVFYITNRRQTEKAGTITNLRKLGFPDVSEETVMTRDQKTPASKESRRKAVASRYTILLLVGDNLNDFNDDFTGKSIADRKAQVDRERVEFGSRFIVVPNPMYGDWEGAIYDNKSNLTDAERRAKRKAALTGIQEDAREPD